MFFKTQITKTRLDKLIGLQVKWTKYLCKVFNMRLEKLTGFHWEWNKTYD